MKIKEFQKLLKKRKIDLAIFYNSDFEKIDNNMLYFSQYDGIGALVIPAKKKPFLIAPKMEIKKARECLIKRVYAWDKGKRLFENVKQLTKKNKIKSKVIGIDKDNFSLNAYKELKKHFKGIRAIGIEKGCLRLREGKTKDEIKIIKKACGISDGILKKCFGIFKKFKTESDVKAYLEYEAKKKGCSLAFPTIVASGSNSNKAHHHTKDTKLKKGFCVIDFGLRYKNYCTDTTRTVYLGKISEKEKDIYNLLLNVQKQAIKNIKINKSCSKVYDEVKKGLKNYKKYFTHGLGHGFGIKIHELPNLTEKSKDRIKNNTAFTVEPGIYLRNFGIRIEDSVLIENNKAKILTKIAKELKVIK